MKLRQLLLPNLVMIRRTPTAKEVQEEEIVTRKKTKTQDFAEDKECSAHNSE